MRELFWLIQHTFRVNFKSKKTMLFYLLTPLIGILIAFAAYGNYGQPMLHIGIVNQDNQPITTDTIGFLTKLKSVDVKVIESSAVDDQITSGKLDCVVKFDAGFAQSVQDGKPDHIEIVSVKGAQITAFVKNDLYRYIDNITVISQAAKGDSAVFKNMYDNYQHASFKLESTKLEDVSKNKIMTYQAVGFLMMIMLLSAGNLSEIILKEKENRTYYRLLTTPIKARSYVFSNVIVNMCVMMVQIIFTLVMMRYVFNFDLGLPFWQMSLVLMLFALVAIGFSLVTVAFANSSNTSGSLQNLIFVPTCMLAGCFWPIDIMPKVVQQIGDFVPQRWVLDTVTQLQKGSSFGSLSMNFLIICAFAVAFFLIAIYKFGRNSHAKNFI
ncbi:ABC transporter permease [Paenibacillus sp. KN14-4R]|uniref:ABC transporter permease n=1 Tax=Paenibacillus sp. KN14-4R TaxID=3445773 RepID=UPI003FA131D5